MGHEGDEGGSGEASFGGGEVVAGSKKVSVEKVSAKAAVVDLLKRICEGDRTVIDGLKGKDEVQNIEPEEEILCPNDAEPLVWNKILKYWECECGWHGKKER